MEFPEPNTNTRNTMSIGGSNFQYDSMDPKLDSGRRAQKRLLSYMLCRRSSTISLSGAPLESIHDFLQLDGCELPSRSAVTSEISVLPVGQPFDVLIVLKSKTRSSNLNFHFHCFDASRVLRLTGLYPPNRRWTLKQEHLRTTTLTMHYCLRSMFNFLRYLLGVWHGLLPIECLLTKKNALLGNSFICSFHSFHLVVEIILSFEC